MNKKKIRAGAYIIGIAGAAAGAAAGCVPFVFLSGATGYAPVSLVCAGVLSFAGYRLFRGADKRAAVTATVASASILAGALAETIYQYLSCLDAFGHDLDGFGYFSFLGLYAGYDSSGILWGDLGEVSPALLVRLAAAVLMPAAGFVFTAFLYDKLRNKGKKPDKARAASANPES